METDVLTISEFLLARIAEDEAWIEATEDGIWALGDEYPPSASAIQSYQRFAAECKAKRRIVMLHDGEHECVSLDRHDSILVAPGFKYWPDPTLRLLASVYADHPDYRQEWKP